MEAGSDDSEAADNGKGVEGSLGESPTTTSSTAYRTEAIRRGLILFSEHDQEQSRQNSFGCNWKYAAWAKSTENTAIVGILSIVVIPRV